MIKTNIDQLLFYQKSQSVIMEYFRCIYNDMLCAYSKRYGCEHVVIKLIDSWKYGPM